MILTDTQSILLSNAAQRDSGSLYPLPASITAPAGGIARSITSLVKRGLAEERETITPEHVWGVDGVTRYGMFITAASKVAIGVEEASAAPVSPACRLVHPHPNRPRRRWCWRCSGATLPELVAATGWLPHTTRAALTGLRKKGRTLDKNKRDGVTCYRIVEAV